MIIVRARGDDGIEKLMRAFKKQVEKSGILTEARKRQSYEKPSVKKKRKKLAARKRVLKQLAKAGRAPKTP